MDKQEFKSLLSKKQGKPCTPQQAEVIDNLNVKEAAKIWEAMMLGQDYLGELGKVARSKGGAAAEAFKGEKFTGDPKTNKAFTADNFDGEKFPIDVKGGSAPPGKMPYKEQAMEVLEAWLLKYGPKRMDCDQFTANALGYQCNSSWVAGDEWTVATTEGTVPRMKREFSATFTMVLDPRDKRWMIRCDHFQYNKK